MGLELSRRGVLQLLGAGAGSAALGVGGSSPAVAAAEGPFTPRGRLRHRPNFLLVIVDEMRYPPVYESEELRAWRANLPSMNSLRVNGVEFTNHHVMSSACTPSRACILTGQHPSLHGVTQTPGGAKTAFEEDMFWLDPTTVPTMGHWFRAAGCDTYYKGKWHVSDADLYQPGSHDTQKSYDANGNRDPYLEQVYLEADRLDAFGFHGWVGPEPHGANMEDPGPAPHPTAMAGTRCTANRGRSSSGHCAGPRARGSSLPRQPARHRYLGGPVRR